MGFLLKDEFVHIHVKLTDEGRRSIAEGNFNPTKFSIGDSEINYEHYIDNEFDFEFSSVMKPLDKNPPLKHIIPAKPDDTTFLYNFDELISREIVTTKPFPKTGFFDINNTLKINEEFVYQPHLQIDISTLNTNFNRNFVIDKTNQYGSIDNNLNAGQYILICWSPINNSENFKQGFINPDKPSPYLWYKITNVSIDIEEITLIETKTITVDRFLPNFGNRAGIAYVYVFPTLDSMSYYYNTINLRDYWEEGFFTFNDTYNASPRDPSVWNMDIVFTERIAGITERYRDNKYFNSSAYAGFLTYIHEEGYKYKNIGIIHFTNLFPDNILGEEFLPETIELEIPTVLSNFNENNQIGIKLKGDIELFTVGDIKYNNLIDEFGNIHGKILHKQKVIVIEDQELLMAMSFKSNRNWTYPKPITNFNIGFGC